MAENRYPTGMTFGYGNYVVPAAQPAVPPKPRLLFDACPLCAERGFAVLRTGDCSRHPLYRPVVAPVMTWMRCEACGHVFTDGYFSPEVAAEIFQRTNARAAAGRAPSSRTAWSRRASSSAWRAMSRPAHWLDVGFGNGSLLFTAQEWGFKPIGLDLRPSSVEALQRLGIEARSADLTTLDEPGRFAMISLADVLEHMPFPKQGLVAAHRLLQPDGVLFVSMPNYDCMAWRLLDAAQRQPLLGRARALPQFQPRPALRAARGTGLRARPLRRQRTLPRLHGSDRAP